MTRFLIATLVLLLSTSLSHAQLNPKYLARQVEKIKDPITDMEWRSVTLNVYSPRNYGNYRSRRSAQLEFIIKNDEEFYDFTMRLVMKSPLDDWPLVEKAFIILNEAAYSLTLVDAKSAVYQIETESQEQDTCGALTTSVETQNFQLFRKEAIITDLSKIIRTAQKIQIVVYSGEKPIVLELSTNDILKLRQVFK